MVVFFTQLQLKATQYGAIVSHSCCLAGAVTYGAEPSTDSGRDFQPFLRGNTR